LLVSRYDKRTGGRLFVAVHSTAAGPAAGGTRATRYPSPTAAAADACALAEAMTMKMAITGLPMGGGKSVLALPRDRGALNPCEWRHLLDVHADTLNTLAGTYWTGPDVNTTSADMDLLRTNTRYAFGASARAGGAGTSAVSTGRGVMAGIRASVQKAGLGRLRGLTVHVQGAGAVGQVVISECLREGARVLVSDVNPRRLEEACGMGAEPTSPSADPTTPCDVFAPCALGGVLTHEVAETLDCRVVAGAANNALTSSDVADSLRRRGILYAPDFVINAGGAIHLIGHEVLHWDRPRVTSRISAIGRTLEEVYATADRADVNTDVAARRIAAERLRRSESL